MDSNFLGLCLEQPLLSFALPSFHQKYLTKNSACQWIHSLQFELGFELCGPHETIFKTYFSQDLLIIFSILDVFYLLFTLSMGVMSKSFHSNWKVSHGDETRYLTVITRAVLCLVAQSCPTLMPARLLCPGDSLGKNTGVGCHALLQGIFPAQGLNPGLPLCRQILYHLSHQGSPNVSVCSYCFVDRNLNSLTFLSISQSFQLCWTINVVEVAHYVSLRYILYNFCFIVLFWLCCFMWKKPFPSSCCLWVSVKKYLHKDISLYNHPPIQDWLLISAPESREICRMDCWGKPQLVFIRLCSQAPVN